MNDVVPLVLLWALAQRGGGGSKPLSHPPEWPSTRSPPPMPAFTPYVPEPAKVAPHGTPLPALHQGAQQPPKPKARASTPQAMARRAASHAASTAVRQASRSFSLSDLLPSSKGPASVSKPVSEIQSIVNRRGGRLKQDGLFGPKTAAAWSALARQHDLPPEISRGGPKVARVVMHSYEVLSVPPIP